MVGEGGYPSQVWDGGVPQPGLDGMGVPQPGLDGGGVPQVWMEGGTQGTPGPGLDGGGGLPRVSLPIMTGWGTLPP